MNFWLDNDRTLARRARMGRAHTAKKEAGQRRVIGNVIYEVQGDGSYRRVALVHAGEPLTK